MIVFSASKAADFHLCLLKESNIGLYKAVTDTRQASSEFFFLFLFFIFRFALYVVRFIQSALFESARLKEVSQLGDSYTKSVL